MPFTPTFPKAASQTSLQRMKSRSGRCSLAPRFDRPLHSPLVLPSLWIASSSAPFVGLPLMPVIESFDTGSCTHVQWYLAPLAFDARGAPAASSPRVPDNSAENIGFGTAPPSSGKLARVTWWGSIFLSASGTWFSWTTDFLRNCKCPFSASSSCRRSSL